MDNYRKIFLIISIILFIGMAFIVTHLYISKIRKRRMILIPSAMALFTIIIYSLFIFSKDYTSAMLFDGLYFACTSWLCLGMLYFTVGYCEIKLETRAIWFIPISFCTVNTISLIANTWRHHSFDLTKVTFGLENQYWYWSCKFTWLQYIHYSWCYILVLISFGILLYKALKVPFFYKRNYTGILITYSIVIIVNIISYSLDLYLDYSVLLYTFLATFICYFVLYSVPNRNLSNALKNVNENISQAIIFFDANEKSIYKNSNAKKLIVDEKGFSEYKAHSLLFKAREKQEESKHKLIEFFIINGEERQYEVEARDIYENEIFIGSYLKLSDKTEEIQKYLTQKFLATHDELTGLYTREHFFELCDEKFKKNPDTEYVMISSNIIQFKLLNELFGHERGNKVLLAIATAAKTLIFHDSIIGRINDDKYCLLAPEKYFDEIVLSEIIYAAQEAMGDSMYKVNLRMGLCKAKGTEESAQYLYDKTQLVIKRYANDYRNFYAWYDSNLMDELLRERQITSEFIDALNNGNISMYLQPFVDGEKKISGAEALARWKHKTYGVMLPDSFIPVLERSGLIHKLDTFIWKEAAKTLERWQNKNITDMQLSVNISSKDIFYIDIPKEFEKLAKEHNFNPHNLKLEFTEDTITGDVKNISSVFKQIKSLGYEIGIDNFGNGQSSLNMLKEINVDVLKMDMILIQKNENPKRSKVILNFISQVSKALGMRLSSEGVENTEQLEMLKNIGCSYFQGFYFSKPMSVDDFESQYFKSKRAL